MHNALITKHIRSLLVSAILVTMITVLGALLWMAREHDKKAAADSQTMIAGGVAALQDQLEMVTIDYAWWEEAYNNVRAQNDDWVYSNMGTGATEADTADILVIVQPDRRIRYAWQNGMEEEPDPAILDDAVVDAMIGRLADVPPSSVEARVSQFDLGDKVAMLAAVRVTTDDFENNELADLPVLIMGYFLSPERLAAVGEGFLIEDLTMALTPDEGKENFPVTGADGQVLCYLEWTPLQPGKDLLFRAGLPISIALGFFAILGTMAATRAGHATNKLANSEAEASHAARTDSLTDLPNRMSFTEKLVSREIQSAASSGELAVLFADVNGFKIVNDTVGHAGGDRLIRELTGRLRDALPKYAFLARVGGDEFNVLLTHRDAASAAPEIASQLIKALDQPFLVDGASLHINAAIGFATSDDNDITAEEVVRRADVAMYEAKKEPTTKPIGYDPAMESKTAKKKLIENALRVGMEAGELKVFYQPIVEAGTYVMSGVEALLRWNSAQLGAVPPATFIPIAEETGLIVDIGRFALEQVCADMADWPGLKVNVNISPVQLRYPLFVENIIGTVEVAGVNPRRIEIELTEGILVSHPKLAHEKLTQLKVAGFTIALDDFGTGFSSIGYLREMSFDKLKIDRSFVYDIGTCDKANNLIQSLVMLSGALDLKVVAEGVETEEQAKLTHLLGCDQLQGYYFAKAMPMAELREKYGEDQHAELAIAS